MHIRISEPTPNLFSTINVLRVLRAREAFTSRRQAVLPSEHTAAVLRVLTCRMKVRPQFLTSFPDLRFFNDVDICALQPPTCLGEGRPRLPDVGAVSEGIGALAHGPPTARGGEARSPLPDLCPFPELGSHGHCGSCSLNSVHLACYSRWHLSWFYLLAAMLPSTRLP